MFCPKCAAQNLDTAAFCRVCGANIKLVPQALTGELPAKGEIETQGRKRGELTLDQSFKNIFMGVAFLFIAFALFFSIGRGWWFWMLIPAFSLMGTGIAQYLRLREAEKRRMLRDASVPPANLSFPESQPALNLLPRPTGELPASPPSVTEGTTRHLGGEARTRHLDASE
ncbi:MAG TPA: zinc ribbon domain-containing protein [Pyrinomonadaceae bacterium]|nr:zinc ribbon domain-containing protein [Pyrinomonadaceae bacterium]